MQGEPIDYAELVVIGARVKARQLPDDAKAAREAAHRLAERIRGRSIPADVEAADERQASRLDRRLVIGDAAPG